MTLVPRAGRSVLSHHKTAQEPGKTLVLIWAQKSPEAYLMDRQWDPPEK